MANCLIKSAQLTCNGLVTNIFFKYYDKNWSFKLCMNSMYSHIIVYITSQTIRFPQINVPNGSSSQYCNSKRKPYLYPKRESPIPNLGLFLLGYISRSVIIDPSNIYETISQSVSTPVRLGFPNCIFVWEVKFIPK
jgi:hypothetical protein